MVLLRLTLGLAVPGNPRFFWSRIPGLEKISSLESHESRDLKKSLISRVSSRVSEKKPRLRNKIMIFCRNTVNFLTIIKSIYFQVYFYAFLLVYFYEWYKFGLIYVRNWNFEKSRSRARDLRLLRIKSRIPGLEKRPSLESLESRDS